MGKVNDSCVPDGYTKQQQSRQRLVISWEEERGVCLVTSDGLADSGAGVSERDICHPPVDSTPLGLGWWWQMLPPAGGRIQVTIWGVGWRTRQPISLWEKCGGGA